MKNLVLISFLLVNSAFAASASWMSMLENVGGKYALINNVTISDEQSNRSAEYSKDRLFYLVDHMALGNIRVQLFTFTMDQKFCHRGNGGFKSDINLYTTYTTPRKIEIGLEAQVGCIVKVYVENKDLNSGNFFKEIE